MGKHLVIATRGSQLALWQTNYVKSAIEAIDPSFSVSISVIKTRGDAITHMPLSEVGGKGLFVKEIEEALLDGRADLAVHSMKDVPMRLPEGLIIGCMPKREVSSDCFLSANFRDLRDLPQGSALGTSSLRRKSQILAMRPDLQILPLRGNVDTRIQKMENGVCEAIILATAGLYRLGLTARYMMPFAEDVLVPAVGQGALGIECSEDNYELLVLLSHLEDRETRVCVSAERSFLARLDGDCRVPIGAHAEMLDEETFRLTGMVAKTDGSEIISSSLEADASLAEETGQKLADMLLQNGAKKLLESFSL